MAHSSPGKEMRVIGRDFVDKVRESKMEITGIVMSCAMHNVNDEGLFRISDESLRQQIANLHRIYPEQVIRQQIEAQRAGMRRLQASAEESAKSICREKLGVSPAVYRRENDKSASPYPFGTVVATASPKGIVKIEGEKVDNIPDSEAPAPAASSRGNTPTRRSPSGGHSSSGNGASRRDGASSGPTGSTSQVYAATSASRRDGPSSRSNSSRPSGNYTSSSRPSGSSSSTGNTGSTRHKTSSTRYY
ncbi:hypothetical protein VTI28DRAFT_3119 [Corynascus sepedonium]